MIDTSKTCYLFFDYDGTVFLNGEAIPKENKEAILKAQKLGHRVILNTGRSRSGLDFSHESNQGIEWDGKIFGATDMIFQNKRIHEHTLAREVAMFWVNYCLDYPCWFALEGEERTKRFLAEKSQRENFSEAMRQEILNEVEVVLQDNPLTKMTVQDIRQEDEPKDSNIRFIRQEGRHVELYPDGRDKGVGFLDFCRHYNIPIEQCACFGDGFNDIAIFEVCPTGVCMKQSPEALKQKATYVATTDFGVAEGLKWLFGEDLDLTNP